MYNPKQAQFMQALQGQQGQQPQPNTNPMSPENAAPAETDTYDATIKAAYEKLQQILPPDIDYQSKYQGFLDEIQNRQVPEHPLSTPGGVASSFAFSVGSPENAPSLINEKIKRHYDESDKKRSDLMKMKENILQSAIQQEITKGNFKGALQQSEALGEIQRATEDRKRAMDMKDWEHKQKTKTADAEKVLRQKAKAIVSQFNLSGKMALKVMDFLGDATRDYYNRKDMLGENVADLSPEMIANEVLPSVLQFAKEISTGKIDEDVPPHKKKEGETPKGKSAYQEAFEKRYGKKK